MLQPISMATAGKSPNRRDDEPSEGIGGIVDELASSWIVGDALTRIVDTGERVVRAQQSALSALGLPSGSQFESLTLRVRTLFHRLEELEDDLDRLERRVAELEAGAKPAPRAAKRPASRGAKKPAARSARAK